MQDEVVFAVMSTFYLEVKDYNEDPKGVPTGNEVALHSTECLFRDRDTAQRMANIWNMQTQWDQWVTEGMVEPDRKPPVPFCFRRPPLKAEANANYVTVQYRVY